MVRRKSKTRKSTRYGESRDGVENFIEQLESQGSSETLSQINHYQNSCEVPEQLQKYFFQRYDIFSKYDDGVWLTDDSWFGVTAEPIANKIAGDVARATPQEKTILIDPFCGVGGNVIAFALSERWETIIAIERDPETLKCARHNAEIYGVQDKILFVEGDSFKLCREKYIALGEYAVIFASPPWGGPQYQSTEIFNLSAMEPYNIAYLHEEFKNVTKDVILYLPRTSDLNEIARFAPESEKLQVAHYCIRKQSKAMCVFFGDFDFSEG